jgi:DNA-binding transcriptional regulator LsrR (DeoR family)
MAWTPADRPQSKAQLAELVQEDDVVGIAWGRTVNAMTAALSEIKRCSIVQMTGALSGAEVSDNAIELVRKMSQISGGAAYPIYAPLLLDDPAAAQSLRGQVTVAEALSCYDRINLAIVPIGSWDPPQSQPYDSITSPGTSRASRRWCPSRHQYRPAQP